MSEIDDILGNVHARHELLDKLRDSKAMFVVWQNPDDTWSHGWVRASFEQLGHVMNGVHTWLHDCVTPDEDENDD